MKKDLKIVKYSKLHDRALVKLYAASYGRKKPLRYFRYRLNQSPFGRPIAYVMKYGKEAVGFYAITPITLITNKKPLLGGYSFLTMTHPNFAGRGIFRKLALKTFETARKKNYNFVFGFANQNSHPIFVKKLGFKELKPINYVHLVKIPKNDISQSKIMGIIPKNVGSMWDEYDAKNRFAVRLDRSYNYIKWRFLEHPLNKYYVYNSENSFYVFKKYNDELHIVEFFGKENEDFYHDLLSTAKSLAEKLECKKITTWIPKKHRLVNYAGIRTNQLVANSFFIVKVFNSRIDRSLSSISNWYYTMSDADVF